MKTTRFRLETLTCPSCISKIESVLNKEPGVENAKVRFNSNSVKVDYNSEKINAKKLASIIEALGYPVISY